MAPDAADTGAAQSADTAAQLHLPPAIVSSGDIRRLGRDLASLEETLQAMRLRAAPEPPGKLPRLSPQLEEFAAVNRLDLLDDTQRQQARGYIEDVVAYAPVLHLSFASEPTRAFLTQIVVWLRSNISSAVIVEVGLEPGIAAGCILRTANRQFDFSLRRHLEAQRGLLVTAVAEAGTA